MGKDHDFFGHFFHGRGGRSRPTAHAQRTYLRPERPTDNFSSCIFSFVAISECQPDSNSGWLGFVVRKMATGDEHEDGDIGG